MTLMDCKIIASGSSGNAILYNHILVDCGVPYAKIKPYKDVIEYVLLTHIHKDHFNKNSIIQLYFDNKNIKFICCEWLVEPLKSIGIKPYAIPLNTPIKLNNAVISAFELYHDIQNCGWRMNFDGFKVFHATDTKHLDGIEAVGYDCYAVEANYNEEEYLQIIEDKKAQGVFCYEEGAMNSHLSFKQAEEFIERNATKEHIVLELHKSSRYK